MVEDSTNPIDALDIEMDAAGLYTEEVVTDRRVGTIRVMTPVKTDGQRDLDRPMLFVGETQIMTQMGPLPVTFEIPADNVGEAVEKLTTTSFKSGAGFGIRWESPIGPVKLDIARPVGDPDEDGLAFYIGLGSEL